MTDIDLACLVWRRELDTLCREPTGNQNSKSCFMIDQLKLEQLPFALILIQINVVEIFRGLWGMVIKDLAPPLRLMEPMAD